MPLYSIDASLERDGFYIVRPTDLALSKCEFLSRDKQPDLAEMQKLVGGYIECVRLNTSPQTVGVIDEEGKMKKKAINGLASVLLDSRIGDNIVGTMLIMCGKAVLK